MLQFVTTLPRTHDLGVDVSKGLTISHMASHPQVSHYHLPVAINSLPYIQIILCCLLLFQNAMYPDASAIREVLQS